MKTILWIIFISLSIVIGLYPFLYALVDMSQGFLGTKPTELLERSAWLTAFYQHIIFGAVAMLSGWSQFSKRLRNNNLKIHKTLGKVYLVAVTLSGVAGLYLALFANGGTVSSLGFSGLAIGWLFTSVMAYTSIRKKDIEEHQYWMIRSYALCWAAVTLRIWLPLFQIGFGIDFMMAYKIISWLCWVPNLIVAEIIITNLKAVRRKKINRPLQPG